MRTTIIHLEPHDDINSTCDKMDWGKTGRILLVWPSGASIFKHRLDFILLKRHSQSLGAQLALVSEDEEARTKANEIGIPVFATESEAQKKPWRKLRWQRRFFDFSGTGSVISGAWQKYQKSSGLEWSNPILRAAVFTIGFFGALALLCVFLPGAKITLPAVHTDQILEISVNASPRLASYSLAGGIPAFQRSIVVEGQVDMPATGKVLIPDGTASGMAQLTNLTSQAVDVPAGTVVMALKSTPVRFLINTNTTVPAGIGKTTLVFVRAQKSGQASNLLAGELQAFEGSLGLKLLVTNPNALLGGSDQVSDSPSRLDYASLYDKLLANLQASALKQLDTGKQPEEIIITQSIKVSKVVEEKEDPPAGLPSNTARLTLRIEFSAWYYRKQDLEIIVQIALDSDLHPGLVPLSDTLFLVQKDDPVLDKEIARWKVQATRQVIKIYDHDQIARSIVGRTPGEASRTLKTNHELSGEPVINIFPDFWPWLPLLPMRIEVNSK